MEVPNEGDTIAWTYGTGTLGTGRATGTVLETGLSKFGYDDVIKVDTGTDVVHIRPEDIE